jgi:hypothetical protein
MHLGVHHVIEGDATGEASDDLESQCSKRHQIELTINHVVQGGSSIRHFKCGRTDTTRPSVSSGIVMSVILQPPMATATTQ